MSSWLALPRPELEPEDIDKPGKRGEWDRRYILRRDDIRDIAFLITQAPEYFERFRSDHDLEKAYSMAQAKKYEEQAKKEADPVGRSRSMHNDFTKLGSASFLLVSSYFLACAIEYAFSRS